VPPDLEGNSDAMANYGTIRLALGEESLDEAIRSMRSSLTGGRPLPAFG
jgi:hypothetical protein